MICIGLSIIVFSLYFSSNSCGARHIDIMTGIQIFENSLDPEFCENLVEKIEKFNLECQPQVEILDCG